MKKPLSPDSPSPLLRYLSLKLEEQAKQPLALRADIHRLLPGGAELLVRNRRRIPGLHVVAKLALAFGENDIAVRQLFAAATYEGLSEEIGSPVQPSHGQPRAAVTRNDKFNEILHAVRTARPGQIVVVKGAAGNGKGDLVEAISVYFFRDLPEPQRMATYTVSFREFVVPITDERGSENDAPGYQEQFFAFIASQLGLAHLTTTDNPLAIAQLIGRKRTLLSFRDVTSRNAADTEAFVRALLAQSFGNIVCMVCVDSDASDQFEELAVKSILIEPLNREQALELIAPRAFGPPTMQDEAKLLRVINCLDTAARVPSSMYLLGALARDATTGSIATDELFDDLRETASAGNPPHLLGTRDDVRTVAFRRLGEATQELPLGDLRQPFLERLSFFTGSFSKAAARAVTDVRELSRLIGDAAALDIFNLLFDDLYRSKFFRVHDVRDIAESRRFIMDRESRDWLRRIVADSKGDAATIQDDDGPASLAAYPQTKIHKGSRQRFLDFILEALASARSAYLANDTNTLDTNWRNLAADDLPQVIVSMQEWYQDLQGTIERNNVIWNSGAESQSRLREFPSLAEAGKFVIYSAALTHVFEASGQFGQGKQLIRNALDVIGSLRVSSRALRPFILLRLELLVALAEINTRLNDIRKATANLDEAEPLLVEINPNYSAWPTEKADLGSSFAKESASVLRTTPAGVRSLLQPMLEILPERQLLCRVILAAAGGSDESLHAVRAKLFAALPNDSRNRIRTRAENNIDEFSPPRDRLSRNGRDTSDSFVAATPERRYWSWRSEFWIARAASMHPSQRHVDDLPSDEALGEAVATSTAAIRNALGLMSGVSYDAFRFRESRLICVSLLFTVRLMLFKASLSQLDVQEVAASILDLQQYREFATNATSQDDIKLKGKGELRTVAIAMSVFPVSPSARNEIKRVLATVEAYVLDFGGTDSAILSNFRCMSALVGRERLTFPRPTTQVNSCPSKDEQKDSSATETIDSLANRVQAETREFISALRGVGDTYDAALLYTLLADQEARLGRLDSATDILLRAIEAWESLAKESFVVPIPARSLLGRTIEMLSVDIDDNLPERRCSGTTRLANAESVYAIINASGAIGRPQERTTIFPIRSRLKALNIPYDDDALRANWKSKV